MNMTNQQLSIVSSQDYGTLVSKAWADPAFNKLLLEDPKAAIAEALGEKVNPNVDVRVVQDKPGSYTLVIPAPPASTNPKQSQAAAFCVSGTFSALCTLGS